MTVEHHIAVVSSLEGSEVFQPLYPSYPRCGRFVKNRVKSRAIGKNGYWCPERTLVQMLQYVEISCMNIILPLMY